MAVERLTSLVPNGAFYLLENTGLEESYEHTFAWKELNNQFDYFMSKVVYRIDRVAPVRFGEPVALPGNANTYTKCDYCMFQNLNYNGKWFYAFVNKIEWVNTETFRITYSIDYIQTYWFQFRFLDSFVVRQHAITDSLYSNRIPENLELDQYVVNEDWTTHLFDDYKYIVCATVDKDGNDAVGGVYSGIYSGLELNVFNTPDQVNIFIENLTSVNKSAAIVSIFMYPKAFIDDKGSLNPEFKVLKYEYTPEHIDGYIPRNKKLLSYPFNLLYVTNLCGNSAEFRYEFFDETRGGIEFYVGMDMASNPVAIMAPYAYKQIGAIPNWNEKITLEGFPQCAWNVDTYRAWLAQSGSSTAISTMGSALSGVANLMSLNFGGAVNSALNIAQTMAQVNATKSQPPQSHGAAGNSAMVAFGLKDFYFYRLSVRRSVAIQLDDYFDMFGYAQHKLMPLNIFGRENWNYIQTQRAKVSGDAPAYARQLMETALNDGITFWHNPDIGNYNKSNRIVVNENGTQEE